MAEGIALGFIAEALENVGKAAFKKAAAWVGARDELKNLKNTISMIQAQVKEAEQHQEHTSSKLIELCLPRLRQVCHRANDLTEKDHLYDLQKQQRERTNNVLKKAAGFFKNSGPLYYNSVLANEIKSIREELDGIRSDINSGNIPMLLPARKSKLSDDKLMQKRETSSFVNPEDVIGREKDQKTIIEMLFHPKYDRQTLTVIPIVGSGGIGKTTLAQCVFNDGNVQKHFDLTKWAYVPKKDDMIALMKQIFKSFTDKKSGDASSLDQIQQGILRSIRSKKFLLVLDDLWDDRGDRLTDLLSLLKRGKRGSKVIVTTRSNKVATSIGNFEVHKLGYLPHAESLKLFKKLAFKPGQEHKNPALSKIGEEIVKMCRNLPLAIKVVAGSLRSKTTEKEWLLVRDAQHLETKQTNGDVVMATLKMSYDDLSPVLKKCFAYCSLFPKGSVFDKDDLVHLWMAQQYIEPSKDIGDQYFLDLLERNIFQDPKFSDRDVRSCRMHDLMHDLAQHVAGTEFMLMGVESPIQVSSELIHINLNRSKCPPSLNAARNLRSLLSFSYEADHKQLLSKIESLRALRVKHIQSELPNSIGKLKLLRYLNLGKNKVTYLPDTITELIYLQTLKLEGCEKVKELPRNFAKLANLRHLLLPKSLTGMPSDFKKMTSLQELNRFIVGENNGIDSLPALNLRGELKITFAKWRKNTIREVEMANLKDNKSLTSITLELNFGEGEAIPVGEMNKMLTLFKLPSNLKYLVVRKYRGDKMPTRWFDGLSKLVSFDIVDCKKCKVLPQLSRLASLKYLRLESLDNLIYVDKEENNKDNTTAAHKVYFPSLEVLHLRKCSKLSKWTRPLKDDGKRGQMLFPSLHKLHKVEIIDCNQLESLMFESPNAIRYLKISGCKSLRNTSEGLLCLSSLSELELRNIPQMKKLPRDIACLTKLQKLFISDMKNLTELSKETGNLSRLHKLSIQNCQNLKSFPKSIQNLTSLQTLCINDCLDLEKQYKKPSGMKCDLIPPTCNVEIMKYAK